MICREKKKKDNFSHAIFYATKVFCIYSVSSSVLDTEITKVSKIQFLITKKLQLQELMDQV